MPCIRCICSHPHSDHIAVTAAAVYHTSMSAASLEPNKIIVPDLRGPISSTRGTVIIYVSHIIIWQCQPVKGLALTQHNCEMSVVFIPCINVSLSVTWWYTNQLKIRSWFECGSLMSCCLHMWALKIVSNDNNNPQITNVGVLSGGIIFCKLNITFLFTF